MLGCPRWADAVSSCAACSCAVCGPFRLTARTAARCVQWTAGQGRMGENSILVDQPLLLRTSRRARLFLQYIVNSLMICKSRIHLVTCAQRAEQASRAQRQQRQSEGCAGHGACVREQVQQGLLRAAATAGGAHASSSASKVRRLAAEPTSHSRARSCADPSRPLTQPRPQTHTHPTPPPQHLRQAGRQRGGPRDLRRILHAAALLHVAVAVVGLRGRAATSKHWPTGQASRRTRRCLLSLAWGAGRWAVARSGRPGVLGRVAVRGRLGGYAGQGRHASKARLLGRREKLEEGAAGCCTAKLTRNAGVGRTAEAHARALPQPLRP